MKIYSCFIKTVLKSTRSTTIKHSVEIKVKQLTGQERIHTLPNLKTYHRVFSLKLKFSHVDTC